VGKTIPFKAENKGRERADLFSKHLTWSNAMERKVKYPDLLLMNLWERNYVTVLHQQMHHHN
jgi:hypothetical protein